MADAQISRPASTAAPADYTVADAAEFVLKTVNADIDGSGAASSFLPAVVILSDSGQVVARAIDQGVTVAAGGSAEVSWFPRVGRSSTPSEPVYPVWQAVDLPSLPTFGYGGGAVSMVLDSACYQNSRLLVEGLNAFQAFYFVAGPRYARYELVFTNLRGPDYGIVNWDFATIDPNTDPAMGYRNPLQLIPNFLNGLPAPVWVTHPTGNNFYNAVLTRNEVQGINFRIEGAQGAVGSAFALDSDGFLGFDGGPGLYGVRWRVVGKDGASGGYKSSFSAMNVTRIDDAGFP